jgi:predicted  nucleic acid-binding Zn-ribbon protein
MRSTALTLLIAVGASAGVAALTTGLLVDTRSSSGSSVPAAAPASAASGDAAAAVAEELRGLREENVVLQQRLDDLEALLAQEIAGRIPIEAVDARMEPSEATMASTQEAAQVAALLGDGGGELPPAFVASVGQALKEIRDEEERQREIRRAEERAARIEERVTELQDELGLTSYQTGEMRVALTTLEEKRDALRQSIEAAGGDRREMFDGFRTVYEETSAELKTILTPEQFELYQQSDRGRFGFGRREGPPGFQASGDGR